MTDPAERRILGLSRRARRVVVPFLVVAAVLIVITYLSSGRSDASLGADPVGPEPHPAAAPGERAFGAALSIYDVIDSSASGSTVQAAGHGRGLRP